MRIAVVIVAALVLAGCGKSPGEKAEEQYTIVSRNEVGMKPRCEAARKVRAAWLEEGDEKRYKDWWAQEYADCAQADRQGF